MLHREDGVLRVTSEPWFVPRSVGLGYRPATWQGWLITVVAVGGAFFLWKAFA